MVDSIMASVAVPGSRLAVRSWLPRPGLPAGRTFLLLHGIAATGFAWAPVARDLCSAGHEVHALDFRGHGWSDRPEDGYDLTTYAADVLAAVEGLALEGPIVIGHSLGANVILAAASARPAAIRRWGGVALVEGGLVPACDQFGTFEECLSRLALPPVSGMQLARVRGYLRDSNPSWSDARLEAALDCFDVDAAGTVSWRLTQSRYEALLRALWDQETASGWAPLQGRVLILAADTGDAAWTSAKRAATESLIWDRPEARVAWLLGDHDIHLDRPADVAESLLETFS
jgi:pimeloyl-ACP methyl ester carboxylesterase